MRNRHQRFLDQAFHAMAPTSSLVCFGDGDGDGDGDGAGGGDEKKEGLDAETKKFIANTVNASVSSFMKRDGFKNAIGEAVQSSVGDAVKAALADFKPAPQDSPDDKKGGSKNAAHEQELAKMRAEQDRMKASMDASKAEADAEKHKAKVQAERGALTEHLRKGGVDDARIGGAVAYLYLDAKRIQRNDDGDIVMSFQREWGQELLPIDKGVDEYLKSDAGKVFLPPVDAGGSGNKGGQPPKRKKGEKPTRTELLTHLGNQMLAGGQVPGS